MSLVMLGQVWLTATRPRFGGLRWWFVCPLVVKGRSCKRRVGKLYLPPHGRYFGCRHCNRRRPSYAPPGVFGKLKAAPAARCDCRQPETLVKVRNRQQRRQR